MRSAMSRMEVKKQKFQYFVRRTGLENAITVRCKFGLYFGEIDSTFVGDHYFAASSRA